MERRGPDTSVGKMWASRAAKGRSGRFSSPVCVESMVVPSGIRTCMAGVAQSLLSTGVASSTKWAVAPVSAITLVWETILVACCVCNV